jgi:hypothetical protein
MNKIKMYCIKPYEEIYMANTIYEFEFYIDENIFVVPIVYREYGINGSHIKDFFIPLEKWREERINKILENDI